MLYVSFFLWQVCFTDRMLWGCRTNRLVVHLGKLARTGCRGAAKLQVRILPAPSGFSSDSVGPIIPAYRTSRSEYGGQVPIAVFPRGMPARH